VYKSKKKNLETAALKLYIYNVRLNLMLLLGTDQHLDGGCSKTTAKFKITDLRMRDRLQMEDFGSKS
jgi:hypothetical protein